MSGELLSKEGFIYKSRRDNTFIEWQELQAHDAAQREQVRFWLKSFETAQEELEAAQAQGEAWQKMYWGAHGSVEAGELMLQASQEQVEKMKKVVREVYSWGHINGKMPQVLLDTLDQALAPDAKEA